MINRDAMYIIKTADIILLISVVIISAGFVMVKSSGSSGKAVIYTGGVKTGELDMKKDSVVDTGKMVIESKNGRISVKKSDCPRQICSHAAAICRPGESIVCVPNKVLIEIESPGEKPGFDALSY